ncbi:MAG: hypothetical protein ACK53L_33915, partial [Pirellulaceae bacterium]
MWTARRGRPHEGNVDRPGEASIEKSLVESSRWRPMPNILDRIVDTKRAEVAAAKARRPMAELLGQLASV